MSEIIINSFILPAGFTVVAAGTSMPERAISVVAAFMRQPGVVVGNGGGRTALISGDCDLINELFARF